MVQNINADIQPNEINQNEALQFTPESWDEQIEDSIMLTKKEMEDLIKQRSTTQMAEPIENTLVNTNSLAGAYISFGNQAPDHDEGNL